ncbi:MAG: YraN family protein [Candidatus Paceibacterota bacterium]|jgi:putative endonuclease
MPKVFTSENQKIGEIGEKLACKYLIKQGFKIIDRNYTKKCGEIDIIGEKKNKLYFFEVKTNSANLSVTHETNDGYRPEENVHPWKIKRLSTTIQVYLLEKNIPDDREWEFGVIAVYLDLKNNLAKIKILDNVIL